MSSSSNGFTTAIAKGFTKHKTTAAASSSSLEVRADKLLVFHDNDAIKVITRLYATYVSGDDIRDLPDFIREIDQVVDKYAQMHPGAETEDEPVAEIDEPQSVDGAEADSTLASLIIRGFSKY
jgi:hypothetical protein